jgi:protein-disulfide isomerase
MSGVRSAGPTRKERREQARVERKAKEAAARARAAKLKRVIQLGSAAAVVVAVIVVIAVSTGGGSGVAGGTQGLAKGAQAQTQLISVLKVLAGIPQQGNVLGSPKAPVTLEYFGDLECPYCKEFTLGAFPTLVQKYVRSGELRIEYRSFETATRDPEVFDSQQIAALAAGKQDKMWYFLELFYHEQGEEDSGYVTPAYIEGIAKQVLGLKLGQWQKDRQDKGFVEQLHQDAEVHNENKLESTPTFLLGKTGGDMQPFNASSLTDPSGFEQAIEESARA